MSKKKEGENRWNNDLNQPINDNLKVLYDSDKLSEKEELGEQKEKVKRIGMNQVVQKGKSLQW